MNETCADVNTVFALKFDDATIAEWLQISGITFALSVGVMSFVKILMVWIVPKTFLGLAIILMWFGFVIVAGACQEIVSNTVGDAAIGACS